MVRRSCDCLLVSVDRVKVEEPLHLFHSVNRLTMSKKTDNLPFLQSHAVYPHFSIHSVGGGNSRKGRAC